MSADACPCGSGRPHPECCRRWLDGADAPTAEALMRSRYTAFALGDVAHLRRTWHPSTRPRRLQLDPGRTWTGLEVLATTGGGLLHTEGTVEFRAHHRDGTRTGNQHETSRFVREGGAWLYVDGVGWS